MERSPFIKDDDFFKSNRLNENGEIETLKKSIPLMPEVKEKPKKRKIPKEVKEYTDKIQSAFKTIDESVNDVCEKQGKEKCVELLEHYSKFKNDLQHRINDIINYSDSKIEEDTKETSKVNITNKI